MTCRSPLVVIGILSVAPCLSAQQFSSPATYTVKPTPKTVAWGYYDAKTPPVLRTTQPTVSAILGRLALLLLAVALGGSSAAHRRNER